MSRAQRRWASASRRPHAMLITAHNSVSGAEASPAKPRTREQREEIIRKQSTALMRRLGEAVSA